MCVRVCACVCGSVMAVSIMSARCLFLFLLGCFSQVLIQGQVLDARRAHGTFLRTKRANLYLLEEILQGNLERECYEEMCNYEEARECFEDTDKTIAFWATYIDGNQCDPNPCLHGGNCTDRVGGFHCSCPASHYGVSCELEGLERNGGHPAASQTIRPEIPECPTGGPTACQQLCTVSHHSFHCSCMPGFKLQKDGRSCQPEVEFPCGTLPRHFNTTLSMCGNHGNCPWQVSLRDKRGVELCDGVVLGRFSVLTAASCLFPGSEPESDPSPSDFYVIAGNKKLIPVQALYVHKRFRAGHHDNDLALLEMSHPLTFSHDLIHLCLPTKDFSENVLMHSGRAGVTQRTGVSQTQNLVYMTLDECRGQLNVSHPLSNKMFCMTGQSGTMRSLNLNRNQNQNQNYQNRPMGPPGGAGKSLEIQKPERSEGNSTLGSEVTRRLCGGLLPGTPVATVDRGTAFLTGLLISSAADCDDGGGLVFTKLSRYLGWIKPRLETAEEHMTPQVNQYPEDQ